MNKVVPIRVKGFGPRRTIEIFDPNESQFQTTYQRGFVNNL